MSGLFWYALMALNGFYYWDTRDDIHITVMWMCLLMSVLARIERKIERLS